MKTNSLFIIVLASCIISSLSCEKITLNQRFKAKEFPFSVNNSWTYERTDSLTAKIDTITLKVIEEGISMDNYTNLWLVTWNSIDTQYVSYQDDQIIFYKFNVGLNRLIVNQQFNFPFEVGDEWKLDYQKGTYTVINDDFNSTILGLGFDDSYYLKREAFADMGYRLNEEIYLKEKIGIIYQYIFEENPTPVQHQVLKLIDYHLE